MGMLVERSVRSRGRRKPDVFLSHSSRDKPFTKRLGEDLCFLEVDVWLDAWELQAGDSLYDVITHAMQKSRYVAVILGDNYADSRWAKDELKQALARERNEDKNLVLPVLCGNSAIPPFLEDKVYIDFRSDYFGALSRLAGLIHGVSRKRIEDAIERVSPGKISECINVLRYCNIEPYVILDDDDIQEIKAADGIISGNRIRFSPEVVASSPQVSQRIKELMHRLMVEVWPTRALMSSPKGEISEVAKRMFLTLDLGQEIYRYPDPDPDAPEQQ